ncbi:MAG: crossover junction endodeoxyribonuclease RuvC [Alphaproteobacteria bacterium]|nr:crossover junction endodeoxyribonuclease RuvC [Alphaproteobacteria bacterium]MCZ6763939.1 crossover junction endodeoxyribonuclease RuvC [Alphaproteobacteria bacterium]
MGPPRLRFLGLDPGLKATGWGLIEVDGNHLTHVANGVVCPPKGLELAGRLKGLYTRLADLIVEYRPDQAAVEETFVNANGKTTLLLGQARGVVMLAPANAGLKVFEYPANLIKKSVVGYGHADKVQVAHMVGHILPGLELEAGDAADALAVAICHAHHAAHRAVIDSVA